MDPQTIQNLLAQKQKELGNRVAAPTYPEVSKDPQWQAYNTQHADKVKQLFNYDSKLAQVSFQPTEVGGQNEAGYSAPESRILDPMIGLQAASQQQSATAGEVGDLLKMMNSRKQSLEDTYSKGLEIYKLGLAAQQLEVDAINKLFSNAMEMEKLKETKRQFNVKQTETKNKMSLEDLLKLGQMGSSSSARPPAFTPVDVNKSYESDGHQWKYDTKTNQWQNITASASGMPTGIGSLNAAQIAYLKQFPDADQTLSAQYLKDKLFPPKKTAQELQREADKQDIQIIISGLDNFVSKWDSTTVKDRLNPFSEKGQTLMTEKDLLTQVVAKIIERNRLSDEDRKFYLKQMPEPWMKGSLARAKILGVVNALSARFGLDIEDNVTSSGDWE
jgi:hypothetical protein